MLNKINLYIFVNRFDVTVYFYLSTYIFVCAIIYLTLQQIERGNVKLQITRKRNFYKAYNFDMIR